VRSAGAEITSATGAEPLKTITGCLAILLGGVGALATLALVGAVWFGAFKISPQVQKVSDQADQSLGQIEDSFDRLQQQLVTTADSVEKVRASAAKARGTAAKADIERMRGDILPLVERADAVHEALPPIAQTLDDAANLAEQTGNKPRADRLRASAGSVREAAKELDSVRDRAAAVRRAGASAQDVVDLAQETHGALASLNKALSGVKQETSNLRKGIPQAREALDQWKFAGAGIATGVLLWIGLGQLALVAWGRRRLAGPVVAAPPPPPGTAPKR
jgi:methyl-accepting chemotaxis protein